MASYTQLTQSDVQEIIDKYFNQSAIDVKETATGISNSNYVIKLEDESSIILKISNDKDLQKLKEEEDILQTLNQSGFKYAILPIKNKINQSHFFYHSCVGQIYPFVNGKVFEPDHEVCSRVGEVLAILHQSQSKQIPHIRQYNSVGYDLKAILDFSHSKDSFLYPDYIQTMQNALSENKCEQILNLKLPQGIIHGDLYYDNVLFSSKREVLAVLDFEQSGQGTLLLDLGISLSGTCLDEDHNLCLKKIKSFVGNYRNQKQLTQEEMSFLYYFIIIGLLSISLWRIDRFNRKKITSNKEDSYKELLERVTDFTQKVEPGEFYQAIFE